MRVMAIFQLHFLLNACMWVRMALGGASMSYWHISSFHFVLQTLMLSLICPAKDYSLSDSCPASVEMISHRLNSNIFLHLYWAMLSGMKCPGLFGRKVTVWKMGWNISGMKHPWAVSIPKQFSPFLRKSSPAHKGLRVCNIFTMTFPELSWYQSLLA